MENASKALIMAAGILIGVIVLSIFAYEFITISNTGEQYGQEIRKRQISEFNSQFEAYAYEYSYENPNLATPRRLKVQEVVRLFYLVSDWNKNNEDDQIDITVPNSIANRYGQTTNFAYGRQDNFKYEMFLQEKSVVNNGSQKSYAVFQCVIGNDAYDANGRIRKLRIDEIGKMIINEDGTETFSIN